MHSISRIGFVRVSTLLIWLMFFILPLSQPPKVNQQIYGPITHKSDAKLSTSGLVLNAQNDTIFTLYSGPFIPSGATWSTDSQFFVFSAAQTAEGIEREEEGWYLFDTETEALTTSFVWPLQPTLTSNERLAFDPYNGSFIYTAPNRHYIVFEARFDGTSAPISIANRQHSQLVNLPIEALRGGAPEFFNVYWDEDSTSFVIKTTARQVISHFYYFVSNISPDLSSVIAQPIESVQVSGHTYGISDVFDLSPNGNTVLLRVVDIDSRGQIVRLALWNSQAPMSSEILPLDATTVVGASLAPDDSRSLLLFNEMGVVRFNTQTGVTSVLRSDISFNPASARSAYFSPNGLWLAVLGTDAVVLLDLRANLEAVPTSE